MTASVRASLTAGVALVGATAVTFASLEVPQPVISASTQRPAAVRVMSDADVELLAAVRPIAATTDVVALNTASDFIVNAWDAAVPWINYGVDLADYVLGFIPFGYLIGDQISMVWYDFGIFVADSFVLDLVAPVVNDPLNGAVWVNGLSELGSTTVTSLINLGIAEFNYFFGWLIPPIPPLPLAATTLAAETDEPIADLAETVVESEPVETDTTVVVDEETETTEETDVEVEGEAEGQDGTDGEDAIEGEEGVEATEPTTTDSSGVVSAQGEVRASTLETEDDPATKDDATDDTAVDGATATGDDDVTQSPSTADTDTDTDSDTGNDSDKGADGGASE